MATIQHTDVILAEANRFSDVLAQADPEAQVPTCPEWTAADLAWHLTEVHLFWAAILAQDPKPSDLAVIEASKPQRPDTIAATLSIREQATTDLVHQLQNLGDDVPRWSWWEPDQSVGFSRRMQTYEATIHRVDAELCAGVPVSPICEPVAAGAIDHVVDVMRAWHPDFSSPSVIATADIRASDTAHRWIVEIAHWSGADPDTGQHSSGTFLRRSPGPNPGATPGTENVTATGSVNDLALWVWGRERAATAPITIEGEAAACGALRNLIDQDVF